MCAFVLFQFLHILPILVFGSAFHDSAIHAAMEICNNRLGLIDQRHWYCVPDAHM